MGLAAAWMAVFVAHGADLTASGPIHLSGATDGKSAIALVTLVNLTSRGAIDPLIADPTPLPVRTGSLSTAATLN